MESWEVGRGGGCRLEGAVPEQELVAGGPRKPGEGEARPPPPPPRNLGPESSVGSSVGLLRQQLGTRS